MWALSPLYPLSVCFTCALKMRKSFKCAFLLLTNGMNLFYLFPSNVDKLNFTINLSLPRIVTVFLDINFHQRNFPSTFVTLQWENYCKKKFSFRLIVNVNLQSPKKFMMSVENFGKRFTLNSLSFFFDPEAQRTVLKVLMFLTTDNLVFHRNLAWPKMGKW